jgi:Uma2 family endonuclease
MFFMDAKELGYYTIDYIDNLPEGERAELINGQIYNMATPSRGHQAISVAVTNQIYNHIKAKKGLCEVYHAPFAVFLHNDDCTYLEPDISVICDPSKLDDKGCHGAPDLIVEIVSPSSVGHDYLLKYVLYEKAGVREYWVVNPQSKEIFVCTFGGKESVQTRYDFSAPIKVGIFDDLEIDFSGLEAYL